MGRKKSSSDSSGKFYSELGEWDYAVIGDPMTSSVLAGPEIWFWASHLPLQSKTGEITS